MNASSPDTFAELRRTQPNPAQQIQIDMLELRLYPQAYERWVEIVNKAIDVVGAEMARTRQHRQGMGEDELTTQLISGLFGLGFVATHDTQFGGHCDLVIDGTNGMYWLGEAKIIPAMDNNYLHQGYEQLLTRYSSGNPDENCGGIIVYCYASNTDQIMKAWRQYLIKKRPQVVTEDCPKSLMAFLSSEPHPNTGMSYTVRHMPIALYFAPQA